MYVGCLILLLSSPHHSTREYAEKEILYRVSGWPHYYGPTIQAWCRQTTCPERAFRLRKPVRIYWSYLAGRYVRPADVPVWPCCDMVPHRIGEPLRDRTFASRWYDQAAMLCDERIRGGPYWNQYRHATELMARGLIAQGWPPGEVDALLREMLRIEVACRSDCGADPDEMREWKPEDGYPKPEGR